MKIATREIIQELEAVQSIIVADKKSFILKLGYSPEELLRATPIITGLYVAGDIKRVDIELWISRLGLVRGYEINWLIFLRIQENNKISLLNNARDKVDTIENETSRTTIPETTECAIESCTEIYSRNPLFKLGQLLGRIFIFICRTIKAKFKSICLFIGLIIKPFIVEYGIQAVILIVFSWFSNPLNELMVGWLGCRIRCRESYRW